MIATENGKPFAAFAGCANAVLLLGALICATYLATIIIDPPAIVEAPWKAAGILLFAAYAFIRGARLAGAGLVFSAAGDAALALDPPVFVAGMAFFGVAHILYLLAFWGFIRREGIDRAGALLALLLLPISLALFIWFAPGMGDLTISGAIYHAIITAMVAAALLSKAPLIARAGAVLFMVSDGLIALGLYKDIVVVPGSIWVAYSSAQLMLAKGLSARAAVR
jgi:uncharacterized membrane protein YhhN